MPHKHRRSLTLAERDERLRRDRERLRQATGELLTSDGWKRWLQARATLHAYSFHNTLLIAQECQRRGFAPTRVAGFKTWLKLGRCVRKGEKGIAILAPIRLRRDIDDADEGREERLFFRTVFVFDTLSRDRRERGQQRRRAIHGRRARLGDGSWVAGATRRVAEVAQHPAARSAVG